MTDMRVVNVKELKARLSSYLRDVGRGETFLVTDRSRVVARLGPLDADARGVFSGPIARLVALGARPPLRERGPTDYRRTGKGSGLSTKAMDELLGWARDDSR